MGNLDLARWQEIHSWDSSIANSNLTLRSSTIDSLETGEVVEEGSVGCSHCQFELWKLWEDTEVSLMGHDNSLSIYPSS